MEIEFNTGRIPQAESSPQTVKRASAPDVSASVSFSASDSLKSQLNSMAAARPEAVAKGKELAAESTYPPDFILDRVAVLLAVHAKASPPARSDQVS